MRHRSSPHELSDAGDIAHLMMLLALQLVDLVPSLLEADAAAPLAATA